MNIGYENEYSTDAMTGGPDKRRQLYYQLIQSMKKAESVDIIVSFLMESGVKMLLQELENTLKRGAKIRILTGNYLGITQPSALYLIKRKLGDRVDLRFYCEKGRSFHPKSYIFHYADHSELYIGSSNISRSALTSGIEWNYRFSSKKDPENYAEFFYTFEDLFENHSIIIDDKELKRYSQNWHRPAVAKDLDKYDFEQDTEDTKIKTMYEPRGAQIEALCALEDTRAEGAKKALIQAATGIGKTYLAAFDSKPYEKVLFVAHREEILKQAADSFRNVRNSEDYGFFTGDEKCTDKSVIFASVATLGKSEYLNEKYFAPDYFNYVVIDEFHHAVNDQYRKIVEYFKPQFLLGLTATPERMDGKNIYEICDYNVPYEISLKDGINKGMLVPFHYYGIYDETDYTKLHIVRGKYAEEELNKTYIGNAYRHDLIYKYYCKYGSKQALGFCCSRKHAEEMAKEFSRRGIPSAAVYSNANGEFSIASIIENIAERNEKVDIFVTHIDGDHIRGLIKGIGISNAEVLKKCVDTIYFNNKKDILDKFRIDSISSEGLEESIKTYIPSGKGYSISEAVSLLEILKKKEIDDKIDGCVFAGRNICIAGASLKIVSPSDKELIQFVTKCTKKVDEDGAVTKGYSANMPQNLNIDLKDLMNEKFPPADSSITNRVSIGFIFEYDDAKIAFWGDAVAPVICRGLKRFGINSEFEVDAVKTSHHGSSRNISNQLLNLIKTDTYLISSNGRTLKGQLTVPGKLGIAKMLKKGGVTGILQYQKSQNTKIKKCG